MAELKETTEITLKLRDEEINYLVSAKQGDRATRYVYAKIQSDDGTEYTIPDNCIAIVNIKKPDKHFCAMFMIGLRFTMILCMRCCRPIIR